MSTADLVNLIRQVKRQPIERGTLYNEIRDYSDVDMEQFETELGVN